MDRLTEEQKIALDQLRSITNSSDDEVAVSVLQSVDWDVQKATELIFEPVQSQKSILYRPHVEPFQIDDSEQGDAYAQNQFRRASVRPYQSSPSSYTLGLRPSLLLSVFTVPFHLLAGIFRFILSVLRIPFSRFNFSTLHFHRPQQRNSGNPERWVRELEEETGAICISRSSIGPSTNDTQSSGTEPGPSTRGLVPRTIFATNGLKEGRKLLPDFCTGSYETFLKACQKEAKIGCVILVSEEHDDVVEFKRNTLTNQAFVTLLYMNDILVWGGDVRDSEAWSASQKLQATTYPFVAFVALQPRRTLHAAPLHANSITNASLTVLSRHAGPSIPASSAPTSASMLSSHLTTQVLPRVQPFLVRIKNSEREREREKSLREEQDQAFRESANRDRERIERLMRADREAEAERRRREAARQGEAERRAVERASFVKRREERIEWSRWGRRVFVEPESDSMGDGALRIAVTLPRTGRVIRWFGKETTLTGLFMYVDSRMISAELRKQRESVEPPNGATGAAEAVLGAEIMKASTPESWWGFKLLLAYPRREIRWEVGKYLIEVEGLRGGGQIVVEMVGGSLLEECNVESESESDEE